MATSEGREPPGYLIHLAAEGVAAVVGGCARVLAAGSKTPGKTGPLEQLQWKGISYFGPTIIDRWLSDLGTRPRAEQVTAFVRLAGLPAAEGHAEAEAAVERFAGGAAPEDKAVAVEYLAAIPLSVRRALVPDPATGGLTLYPSLAPDNEYTLIRLLPADVPPFAIGTVLPGTSYELEELLGVGGFGAVYKARNRFEQNQPPRAIKFCLDASMVATLHRERAILDRLMAVAGRNWSDRIVRLYGYALDVQPPFLVYEYVPGGDLASHLTATRQKTGRGYRPAVALEVVRQVAEALAFAHGQGLVHRDLKPANILVSGATIKLTDFGIGGVVAAVIARGGQMTGSLSKQLSAGDPTSLFRGSGTPLYMSVEQRRGENPDPRHDLYSLGVVWYQLLVGDVTRELHPGWPDELTEEFQTPAEHIELIQRCVGYYKKRPAHAGELLPLLPPAPRPPEAADPRRLAADYDRLKALLAEQIDRDALAKARDTAAAMLRLRPEDPEVLEARAFIDGRLGAAPGEILCLAEHQGWVRCVALLPDGRRALSGGDDATLRLWDLTGRRELCRFAGHSSAVMSVAVTPDGRRALSGGWDGLLCLWDLDTGRQLGRIDGPWKAVKAVAVAPGGRRALSGSDDRLLHLWDLETGRELARLAGHTDLVQSVAVAPDGRRALSGSDDNSVRLWDLDAGQELRRYDGHTDTVTSVAFSPDGRWFVSGSSDTSVRVVDVETGRELRRLRGHTNWVNSVAVSADGRQVLTGSGGEVSDGRFRDGPDTTVRLWDVAGGKELRRYHGHLASVTSVALSADGAFAVSGSLDKTVRAWELPRAT
jgi:serine/threonine protein kinase